MKRALFVLLSACAATGSGSEGPEDDPFAMSDPSGELSIVQPVHGTWQASSRVRVSGTVTRPEITEVFVSDEPVAVEGGEFQTTLDLPAGTHRILVRAEELRAQVDVHVDPDGPELVLAEPLPGAFINGNTLFVTGRVNDASPVELSIDGQHVNVDGSGAFQFQKTVEPGAHRVRLVATDAVGHTYSGYAAAIVGELSPVEDLVPEAVTVLVGQTAFQTLAAGIEPRMSSDTIEPLLLQANPMANGTWGSVVATGERHDPASLSLASTDEGITVDLMVPDIRIPFQARLPLGFDLNGQTTMDYARLQGRLELGVTEDGRPTAVLQDPSVEINDLFVSLDALWDWANEHLVTANVGETVRSSIVDAVHTQVPPAISTMLEGLPTSEEVELYGYRARVEGSLTELTTSQDGLRAVLNMGVSPASSSVAMDAPGTLTLGTGPRPAISNEAIVGSVSLDMINAAFLAAWRVGGFTFRFDTVPTGNDGVFTVGLLDLIVPIEGVDSDAPIAINASAMLPPVIRQKGTQLEVHGADIRMDLFAPSPLGEVSLIAASGSVRATVEPFFNEAGIGVRIVDQEVHIDSLRYMDGLPTADELDSLLGDLLQPLFTHYAEFAGFTLPSFAGFAIQPDHLGAEGNQIVFRGRLEAL